MGNKTVLVSGGSIAGPTLAFWLNKHGFKTTIVERVTTLRLGGQNIDISGAARAVVRKMGIETEIITASTGELGVRFVDENDVSKAVLEASTDDKERFMRLEILRGDLSKILYEHTKNEVEYLFGNQITALEEQPENVKVTFQNGTIRHFDFVIAADGIRSSTRNLMFGNEAVIKFLKLYIAYFTIPKADSDTNWARWYNAKNSRAIFIRPDNVGTTRVSFSFMSAPKGYEKLTLSEQKAILKAKFEDVAWEAPRILKALDSVAEIHTDAISQVNAPRWSNGRFAMVGDAAFCPSPLSGMGASLSVVGAYVLAGEMSKHTDPKQAFDAYEKLMRPYVKTIQQLPPGVPRLAHPKGKFGLFLMHTVLNIISSRFVKKLSTIFSSSDQSELSDSIELPDYGK